MILRRSHARRSPPAYSRSRASSQRPYSASSLSMRRASLRDVVAGICALAPRAVAYVACDPAALARDLAIFAEHDYRLRELRGFDLFPMTHHVECVALLEKTGPMPAGVSSTGWRDSAS